MKESSRANMRKERLRKKNLGRKRDTLERQKSDYFPNINFRVSLGLLLKLLLALLLYAKWIVNMCAIFYLNL